MRRQPDERGAIAAISALTLVVVVTAAAFAVDLGMQRVVRSDMQALADAVALDAARLLDGRTAGKIRAGSESQPPLATVVAESAERNSDAALGDVDKVSATLVRLTVGPNGELVPLRLGGATSPVAEVGDAEVPDAVMVTAAGAVDFAFAPGSGGASRSALANASPFACFRLGSFAASLSVGDSALNSVFESLVGDALGLSLRTVGYQGLLDAQVGIDALAAELGAGSPEELAALDTLSVGRLLSAAATVLDRQGNSAASADLGAIATKVSSGAVVDLGELLSVGDDAAMQGSVNAVDLLGSVALGAGAVVANGNNFLDTGVVWSEPHTSAGTVALEAIQAPRQACGAPGAAQARTAQVALRSDIGFTLPNRVSGLDVSIQTDKTTKQAILAARASLAGATGALTGVTCAGGTATDPEEMRVRIDRQLLSTSVSLPFRMSGQVDPAGIVPAPLLAALPATATVKVDLDLMMSMSASTFTAPAPGLVDTAYRVPPRTYRDVEPGGGDPVSLPSAAVVLDPTRSRAELIVSTRIAGVTTSTTTTLDPAALNLSGVTSAVSSSVIGTSTAALVANINAALVPVSRLLGIRTNGADLLGVPRPNCSLPALVG